VFVAADEWSAHRPARILGPCPRSRSRLAPPAARRLPRQREISLAAAAILAVWIVVQVLMIGFVS
jgi:hypothetical protein